MKWIFCSPAVAPFAPSSCGRLVAATAAALRKKKHEVTALTWAPTPDALHQWPLARRLSPVVVDAMRCVRFDGQTPDQVPVILLQAADGHSIPLQALASAVADGESADAIALWEQDAGRATIRVLTRGEAGWSTAASGTLGDVLWQGAQPGAALPTCALQAPEDKASAKATWQLRRGMRVADTPLVAVLAPHPRCNDYFPWLRNGAHLAFETALPDAARPLADTYADALASQVDPMQRADLLAAADIAVCSDDPWSWVEAVGNGALAVVPRRDALLVWEPRHLTGSVCPYDEDPTPAVLAALAGARDNAFGRWQAARCSAAWSPDNLAGWISGAAA